MPRFETLAALEAFVARCEACPLRAQAHGVVFGEGVPSARIVFCGEGPGADEDRLLRPFVGRAGQLLDQMLEASGFDRRRNAYILNVVKCRPPDNRTPTLDERTACLPHLEAQLALIDPVIIVLLGATALKTLIAEDAKITGVRGQWFRRGGRWCLATFHPAALLRNPSWKVEAWTDLKRVIDKYRELVDPAHEAPGYPRPLGPASG